MLRWMKPGTFTFTQAPTIALLSKKESNLHGEPWHLGLKHKSSVPLLTAAAYVITARDRHKLSHQ